jgi:hypothetical protein
VGRAAEQDKIGQALKQIEIEERDGPVLRELFGGGTGETGGGKKGIEGFGVTLEN